MRRALLIGIDQYPNAPLSSCVADAERLSRLLASHQDGSPNFDCRTLLAARGSSGLGRARVLESMEQHFAKEADALVLHFAGHGVVTERGGFLATSDARRYEEGIAMRDLLVLANRSPVQEITLLIDCCHSGGLGATAADNAELVTLREGVAFLTASGMDEVSLEASGAGLFSGLICDALEGQAADVLGQVTVASLYSHLDFQLGAWDQRPRFRANLKRLSALRLVEPRLQRATLRRLVEHFPTATTEFALDASFEPSSASHEPERGLVFAELQRLAREGLVEPVGATHMYHAAMNGAACRLTATGRRFWLLAKRRRI